MTEDHETGDGYVDIYELFGIEKSATLSDIKKAYRKLALKYHPDKLSNLSTEEERLDATRKFQDIVKFNSILTDEKKRKKYDLTGKIDEGDVIESFEGDWQEYFNELWCGVVNATTIAEFEKSYVGSEEETADVIKCYLEAKGDIDVMLSSILCSSVDSEDRYKEIITKAIAENPKDVPRYEKYFKKDVRGRNRRLKQAKQERLEAEEYLAQERSKGNDLENEDALKKLIAGRQKERYDGAVAAIEEKYTALESKRKGNKAPGKIGKKAKIAKEPTDEEFEAIQARMFSKK